MKPQNGVYLLIGKELKKVKDYNNEDAKVVVIYEGTGVLISPKTLGEAEYDEAVKMAEANGVKLGNTPDWAIVGLYLRDVNYALKSLGHDVIGGEYWTGAEYTSIYAWGYRSRGDLGFINKNLSFYIRPLSSFPLDALITIK